jgi:competence CoiA-like predicted nuclease
MLVAMLEGKAVEAKWADRRRDYRCGCCDEPVVLRRGAIVSAHFAHRPRSTCPWRKGEGATHMQAKMELAEEFRRRGAEVSVERVLAGLDGDRRADVFVESGRDRVVLEIQHSDLPVRTIEARARFYAQHGITQIWITVLPRWVLKRVNVGLRWFFSCDLRPYEKWIHGFHKGRGMWAWDPERRALWRLKRTADGRAVAMSGPFDAADLRFRKDGRGAYEAGGYSWPEAVVARFEPRAH